MDSREIKILKLKARIAIMESNEKENSNIIKKCKRQLRTCENA